MVFVPGDLPQKSTPESLIPPAVALRVVPLRMDAERNHPFLALDISITTINGC
jgi:hypothetical protein